MVIGQSPGSGDVRKSELPASFSQFSPWHFTISLVAAILRFSGMNLENALVEWHVSMEARCASLFFLRGPRSWCKFFYCSLANLFYQWVVFIYPPNFIFAIFRDNSIPNNLQNFPHYGTCRHRATLFFLDVSSTTE